ncbi:MAG: Mpo1-like protein [Blastocatellia bacterium]
MDQTSPDSRLKSFEEFWPFYVREHSHPINRALHFIGSTLGLVCLAAVFSVGNFWFVPLGLVLGYGFAWIGHFFVEHNIPASFNYPFWSFCGDWKMWALILTGQMEPEVHRAIKNT